MGFSAVRRHILLIVVFSVVVSSVWSICMLTWKFALLHSMRPDRSVVISGLWWGSDCDQDFHQISSWCNICTYPLCYDCHNKINLYIIIKLLVFCFCCSNFHLFSVIYICFSPQKLVTNSQTYLHSTSPWLWLQNSFW